MAVIVYYRTFVRSALDFQSYLTSSRSKSYLCSQNLQPTKSWFQLLATVKDIIRCFFIYSHIPVILLRGSSKNAIF